MPTFEIVSAHDCPMPVPIWFKPPAGTPTGGALLKEAGGALTVPLQKDGDYLVTVLPSVKAGQKRRFDLTKGSAGPGVSLKAEGEHQLSVMLPDGLFTTYHFAPDIPRPFLHPVIGPDKRRMTRDFPMLDVAAEKAAKDQDHKHHRSFWTAYGEVNGVDDWSEDKAFGRIKHQKLDKRWEGSVFGGFSATNQWTSSEGMPLLDEKRTLKVYAIAPDYRLLDYDVELIPNHGDVHYGDTKEGGLLAFRVYYSMKGALGGKMVNALGGVGEKQVWGKRAAWLDYAGMLENGTYGIAMMDHPSNLNHPCYWHARDYGLVGTNPFAKAAFEGGEKREWLQKKGEPYRFRYRVLLHRGDHKVGNVEASYHAWIQPPTVTVVP